MDKDKSLKPYNKPQISVARLYLAKSWGLNLISPEEGQAHEFLKATSHQARSIWDKGKLYYVMASGIFWVQFPNIANNNATAVARRETWKKKTKHQTNRKKAVLM